MTSNDLLRSMLAAEDRALALLDAGETAGLASTGLTPRDVNKEIDALNDLRFGFEHWHKRTVRAGFNTLGTFSAKLLFRMIDAEGLVPVDLGLVYDNREAGVGRSYAICSNPVYGPLAEQLLPTFKKAMLLFQQRGRHKARLHRLVHKYVQDAAGSGEENRRSHSRRVPPPAYAGAKH